MIVFRGYTHISISIALFLVLSNYFTLNRPIIPIIFFISLGSILADIDHPSSIVGRLIVPISAVVEHRGFTHTLIGALALTVPILLYDGLYFIAALAGYILHLLSDTLTPTGVRWLYPIKKRKYSLRLARTGGAEEAILFSLSLLYIFKTKFF